MFKPRFEMDIDTNYNLKLVDDKTGQLKQEVNTHNVFCTGFWNPTVGYWHRMKGRFAYKIDVGSGTGTPSESDTALFSPLWSVEASESYETPNATTLQVTATAEYPATESYVGNITEIGCQRETNGYYHYLALMSHALLQDAEGHPIRIEKTDTDRLIVTVLLRFQFQASSPWQIVPVPEWVGRAKAGFPNGSNTRVFAAPWDHNWLCLGVQPEISINYGFAKESGGDSGGSSGYYYPAAFPDTCYEFVKGTLTQASKEFTFANTRMPVDYAKDRPIYFNLVLFPGYCYAKLPNRDIFPYYEIDNISIGTGDGQTTDFLNPLDFFPENAEVIYKNGTALVRGVDYTIDHCHNARMLPELTDAETWTFLSGIHSARANFQLFQRNLKYHSSFYQGYDSNYYTGWDNNNPLIIDMGSPHKINTFHFPSWVVRGTVTLSYSTDAEVWTEVASFSHVNGTENLVEFETVTARYWKIAENNTSWTDYATGSNRVDKLQNELFLGFVGDKYIRFTQAPADGDVLTMKVTMDRPFKNGNFVIDCSAQMSM